MRAMPESSSLGGLRCPSEHLALQWGDINWEAGRMIVRSPKTEHHEGKESRIVPIYPELLPYLEAASDEARPGIDCPLSSPVISRYRDANSNLRTQMQRIIAKAGVQAWPKLFQNLRSTRQTELAEEFPAHVVCAWMGNSEAVAAKHYLQVTDEHFGKASTAHRTAQAVANSTGPEGAVAQADEEKCYTVPASHHWSSVQVPPVGLEPTTH